MFCTAMANTTEHHGIYVMMIWGYHLEQ